MIWIVVMSWIVNVIWIFIVVLLINEAFVFFSKIFYHAGKLVEQTTSSQLFTSLAPFGVVF